jgi:hypothetical protein
MDNQRLLQLFLQPNDLEDDLEVRAAIACIGIEDSRSALTPIPSIPAAPARSCLKEERRGRMLTSHPKEDSSLVLGTHIFRDVLESVKGSDPSLDFEI